MKILIISGAGLLAGTYLYNTLISEIVSHCKIESDDSYPEIILYNYPFKSIGYNGFLDKELAKLELNKIYNLFADIDIIILACNTYHLLNIHPDNLLSLPEIVKKSFKEINFLGKKGLVLCSKYSRDNNLFNEKYLEYPSIEISETFDEIIKKSISSNVLLTANDFLVINRYIKENKITHLIIGCTELSMLLIEQFCDVQVLDSAKLAIKEVVNQILEKSYENI